MMYTENKECLLELGTIKQLKGLGIILVILSHFGLRNVINMPYIVWAGQMGVAIFLFASGYGLTKSYLKNGLSNYFVKRWNTVMLPYIIITFLWIIVNTLFKGINYNITTINLAILGLDFSRTIDGSMWYITYIILWYIIFYIIYSLPFKDIWKVLILFYIAFLMFSYYPDLEFMQKVKFHFSLYSFILPIGSLMGLYFDQIMNKLNKYIFKILLILCSMFLIFFIIMLTPSSKGISQNIQNMKNVFWVLGITLLFIVFSYKKIRIRFLELIGEYSYELYLVEFVLLDVFKYFNKYIALLIYVFLLILLSSMLKKITPVFRKILFK